MNPEFELSSPYLKHHHRAQTIKYLQIFAIL